ncbi:hypothetical protein B5S29_g183 [[Candida] boidinii]|nr:hypothetical protein B5S29_g183 [[Candida] boidinii]
MDFLKDLDNYLVTDESDNHIENFENHDKIVSTQKQKHESNFNSYSKNDNDCLFISDTANSNTYNETSQTNGYGENTNTLLVKTAIPYSYSSIFKFSHFNAMQSESFDTLFNSDQNCVISSPTGSGKTVLFELAIIRLMMLRSQNKLKYRDCKILYVAPTKALCSERADDWAQKFKSISGFSVGLLTSDTSFLETERVKKSDIIICTPEKWDVLTRRWNDYPKLFELIRLLLVDEIHTLNGERGSVLEVVVTRMKSMNSFIRIVALSATVPNIDDVSKWLSTKQTESKILKFDNSYRAVSLKKIVYAYSTSSSNNNFQFDSFLNGKLTEIITKHSKGKPIMIFCPTRSSAISTARYLADNGRFSSSYTRDGPANQNVLLSKELKGLTDKSVAYHHAGLAYNERIAIENMFIEGKVKVICSTSTLAVGVNLPAYLVIVKGTKAWNGGIFSEYSDLDILQMIGRAGRPQFEKEGCAVIMTQSSEKDNYEKLIHGTQKLESSLHLHLQEHITAEISLGTITSVMSALLWLKSTFLYQRFMKNPLYYSEINKGLTTKNYDLELKLIKYFEMIINELIHNNMITEKNGNYTCTPHGITMAKHYILLPTMKLFIECDGGLSFPKFLELFCLSTEFKSQRLKHQEKKLFKEVNQSPLIRYKIESKNIETTEEKVSLLLQYELGGIEFPKYEGAMKLHTSFVSDKMAIFRQASKILKGASEVFIERLELSLSIHALQLLRCIQGKCWENSPTVLRQIDGIGLVALRKLSNHNICSFSQLMQLTPPKLEYILNMKPPNGNRLLAKLARLPKFVATLTPNAINSNLEFIKDVKGMELGIEVNIGLANKDPALKTDWNGTNTCVNIVSELNGTTLLDFRRIPLKKLCNSKSFMIKFRPQYSDDRVIVHINCDNLAGVGISPSAYLSDMVPSNMLLQLSKRKPTKYNLTQSQIPFIFEKSLSSIKNKQHQDDTTDSFSDISDYEILNILDNRVDHRTGNIPKKKEKDNRSLNPQDTNHTDELIPEVDNTFTRNHERNSDGTFKCNHKCKNRDKCRHLCCKSGIPKEFNKLNKCNHNCKNKIKCRHFCCKQNQYPNIVSEQLQVQDIVRESPLEFSKYSFKGNPAFSYCDASVKKAAVLDESPSTSLLNTSSFTKAVTAKQNYYTKLGNNKLKLSNTSNQQPVKSALFDSDSDSGKEGTDGASIESAADFIFSSQRKRIRMKTRNEKCKQRMSQEEKDENFIHKRNQETKAIGWINKDDSYLRSSYTELSDTSLPLTEESAHPIAGKITSTELKGEENKEKIYANKTLEKMSDCNTYQRSSSNCLESDLNSILDSDIEIY